MCGLLWTLSISCFCQSYIQVYQALGSSCLGTTVVPRIARLIRSGLTFAIRKHRCAGQENLLERIKLSLMRSNKCVNLPPPAMFLLRRPFWSRRSADRRLQNSRRMTRNGPISVFAPSPCLPHFGLMRSNRLSLPAQRCFRIAKVNPERINLAIRISPNRRTRFATIGAPVAILEPPNS